MLRRPPKKKLSRERQKAFWEKYDAGKVKPDARRQFILGSLRYRAPVKASATMMGTVRTFEDSAGLRAHLKLVERINKVGKRTKFSYFVFHPTQILSADRKNLRTLERVYRAPNMLQLLGRQFNSPFIESFMKKMGQKKVGMAELRTQLERARKEIRRKIGREFDDDLTNFLVLDYDPATKKPLIVFVDHGHSKPA
ncbi:MAG: hypothetical protein JW772_00845 [Candidatus Diapherotrites archaeon]|nr:hypothetical protein [Candidatus Diapherotrites archaeon]